jgi:hypothetical protein
MRKYGYETGGEFRVTGVHRANVRCSKSGLTLKVREYHVDDPDSSKPDWVRDENGEKNHFRTTRRLR